MNKKFWFNGLVCFTLSFSLVISSCSESGPEKVKSELRYDRISNGTRRLQLQTKKGAITVKILADKSNLGGTEIEIGEIFFPAGTQGSNHTHDTAEMFYVLEGELEHIVNEESYLLVPGMLGIVRAGDQVIHRVRSATPVKALVIWVPGGESERLISEFGFGTL